MSTAIEKAKAAAVAEVFTFVKKRGLTLEDLIEISGEDLKSPNPKKVEKAKRVEKCWSLMAKLDVKYADLELAAGVVADKAAGRICDTFDAGKVQAAAVVFDFIGAGNDVDTEQSAEQRKRVYADSEDFSLPSPEKSTCGERGEGHFSEVPENKELLDTGSEDVDG